MFWVAAFTINNQVCCTVCRRQAKIGKKSEIDPWHSLTTFSPSSNSCFWISISKMGGGGKFFRVCNVRE